MSVRHIARNTLLAAVVPAAAALAVLAGPAHAQAQGVSHNPPADVRVVSPTAPAALAVHPTAPAAHPTAPAAHPTAPAAHPTAPAAAGIDHNPPTY